MRIVLAILFCAIVGAVEPGTRSALLLKEAEDASIAYVATVLRVAKAMTEAAPPLSEEQKKDINASPEGRKHVRWSAVRSWISKIENCPDLPMRVQQCYYLLNQMYGFYEAIPPKQPTPPPPPAKVRGGKN